MIKELIVNDMGGIRIQAPEWINLPIDEQIQFQVSTHLKERPNAKVMVVFTYDVECNHWQKRTIEL